MAVIRKETAKGRTAMRRLSGNKLNTALVIFLCICGILIVYVNTMDDAVLAPPSIQDSTMTMQLSQEPMFLSTIKSCMPPKDKCKIYIPKGTTAQRVALIAPPGEISDTLHAWIQNVIQVAQRHGPADIELIQTSHIPPYGYGKTHGLTRIMRIVPTPLLLGATSTLLSALSPTEGLETVSMDDLKASLRQQLRYHCRFSHIAAHTTLWSTSLDSLVNTPVKALVQQIQEFLGLEIRDILSEIPQQPDDFVNVRNSIWSQGVSLMSTLGQKSGTKNDNILSEMNAALSHELVVSRNQSAWPCQSFWTVGNGEDGTDLSPILSRISWQLSPNCSAPYTDCWVKRDKCEADGNGKCDDK